MPRKYDLAFSPDSTRLYDIRGSFGNVWGPSCLLKLVKGSEGGNASGSSMAMTSKAPLEISIVSTDYMSQVDHIISLAGQPHGPLYCFATERGRVVINDANRTRIVQLERVDNNFALATNLSWNHDGTYLAYVKVAIGEKLLRIYAVTISSPQESYFNCQLAFQKPLDLLLDLPVHLERSYFYNLFFLQHSNHLLVKGTSSLKLISFSDGVFTCSTHNLNTSADNSKGWLDGPFNHNILLQLML
jgi:hypothetical protein